MIGTVAITRTTLIVPAVVVITCCALVLPYVAKIIQWCCNNIIIIITKTEPINIRNYNTSDYVTTTTEEESSNNNNNNNNELREKVRMASIARQEKFIQKQKELKSSNNKTIIRRRKQQQQQQRILDNNKERSSTITSVSSPLTDFNTNNNNYNNNISNSSSTNSTTSRNMVVNSSSSSNTTTTTTTITTVNNKKSIEEEILNECQPIYDDEGTISFHHIPNLPNSYIIKEYMKRIAKEFIPIIKRRNYNIISISELCCCDDGLKYSFGGIEHCIKSNNVRLPGGHTVDDAYGYNEITKNWGTNRTRSKHINIRNYYKSNTSSYVSTIHIRLRDMYNHNIVLPYEQIVSTLCHELAHCIYFDHSNEFYKLMDEIQNEYEHNLIHDALSSSST